VDPESTYDVIVDDEGHHQQGLCETVGWDYYGVFFLNGTDACEMALQSESLGVRSRPAAWLGLSMQMDDDDERGQKFQTNQGLRSIYVAS
jgi:hypothetical protein